MDYIESIHVMDEKYKKRAANIGKLKGRGGRPKKKRTVKKEVTPKQTCWACGKKVEYQLGLCSTCYQRLRSGKFLFPDMSAYDWDEKRQLKDWRNVAAFYHRFFKAAEIAGVSPQMLLTSAIEEVVIRAGT